MEQELYRQPRSGAYAQQAAQSRPGWDAGRIVAGAGAVTSIALILGLGVWGYRLAVRDVHGVPVVRALAGPSRVAPEEPGGDMARHTGLAVNAVAAEGTAAAPPDQIALAPASVDLVPEALPMGELAETAVRPASEPPAPAAPAATAMPEAETLLSAADEATGVTIPTPVALDPAAGFVTAGLPQVPLDEGSLSAALEEMPASDVIATSVPGVIRSPRPPSRPEGLGTRIAALGGAPVEPAAPAVSTDADPALDPVAAAVAAAVAQAIAAPGPSREIDAATLPAGTRLVQLGAFDDAETARAEWAAVEERFGPLMAGKDRVIEPAESGGRAFYRLRVAGFEDTADARRFCAALLAEGTACIPAQSR